MIPAPKLRLGSPTLPPDQMLSGVLRRTQFSSLTAFQCLNNLSRRNLATVTKPGAYGQPLHHSHPHLGQLHSSLVMRYS